jgi:hypothetical protein
MVAKRNEERKERRERERGKVLGRSWAWVWPVFCP